METKQKKLISQICFYTVFLNSQTVPLNEKLKGVCF